MDELKPTGDSPVAHHALMALTTTCNGKPMTRLLSAMLYALERGTADPEWADKLRDMAKEQITKQQKLEFISLLAKECRVPCLSSIEKLFWQDLTVAETVAKFISRTEVIGEFPKGLERLQQIQSWGIGLEMEELILDFQKQFVETMSHHPVCQRYGEEISQLDVFRPQNRKDSRTYHMPSSFSQEMVESGKEFMSVDMMTGNFSVFFYFWGYHCLKLEPEFESWEDLAKTIFDNPFLVTSKKLRGSSFGKLFKTCKMVLEQTMTYIMELVYDKLGENGYHVVMFNLDEVVVVGDVEVDKLQQLVCELEPVLGKYMIERFRFEPFTLEYTVICNRKRFVRKRTMDGESRLYGMDPNTAATIYEASIYESKVVDV